MSTFAEMSPRLRRSLRRTLYWRPPSDVRRIDALFPSAKSVIPPTCDHQVEYRHPLAIRNRLRFRGLAYDANLFRIGPDEPADDDGDDRVANVFRQYLLDVARKGRRVFPEGRQVFDERRRDLSVGPHDDRHRELRVAPDCDVHAVARPDLVKIVGRSRVRRSFRIRRRGRTAGEHHHSRGQDHPLAWTNETHQCAKTCHHNLLADANQWISCIS